MIIDKSRIHSSKHIWRGVDRLNVFTYYVMGERFYYMQQS